MRALYAHFGRAIYMAQAVEASLKGALVLAQLDTFGARDDFEREWTANFNEMMGRLVPKLVPYLGGDDQLASDLRLARKLRNQLVHHFFWDHTTDILETDGVDRMIAECAAATELFEEVDGRLYSVMRRFAAAHGVHPVNTPTPTGGAPSTVGGRICGRCLVPMVDKLAGQRPYFECLECKAVALT